MFAYFFVEILVKFSINFPSLWFLQLKCILPVFYVVIMSYQDDKDNYYAF